jgi:hypothetical protein
MCLAELSNAKIPFPESSADGYIDDGIRVADAAITEAGNKEVASIHDRPGSITRGEQSNGLLQVDEFWEMDSLGHRNSLRSLFPGSMLGCPRISTDSTVKMSQKPQRPLPVLRNRAPPSMPAGYN